MENGLFEVGDRVVIPRPDLPNDIPLDVGVVVESSNNDFHSVYVQFEIYRGKPAIVGDERYMWFVSHKNMLLYGSEEHKKLQETRPQKGRRFLVV